MRLTKAFIAKKILSGSDTSGSFGTYFRLNKNKGIKVIGYEDGGFNSTHDLKSSRRYKEAVKEYNMLKLANSRTKMVAKTYGIETFYVDGSGEGFHVGIVLEHISGCTLEASYADDEEEIMDRLVTRMNKLKIYIKDYNPSNFIRHWKHGWRIIDFSPGWVTVTKMKA